MELKPFVFEKGEGKKCLDIFNVLYVENKKIRHVIWMSPGRILFEKTVSTKDVNEFIIEEPSPVDKKLVLSFGREKGVPVFKVSKIEETENKKF